MTVPNFWAPKAMACIALFASSNGFSQSDPPSKPCGESSRGTPIAQLIETVSKKTGKAFIVDPRVNANVVLIGMNPANITYAEFLSVLQVYSFAAIESGNVVLILPDNLARLSAVPLITGTEKRPGAEHVTRVIHVKSTPAALLVPILRSLIPQNAHLAALACTNQLLMVDTHANVRRIEAIVAAMDTGDPIAPAKCTVQ
jgi:general secretion pathway protein D